MTRWTAGLAAACAAAISTCAAGAAVAQPQFTAGTSLPRPFPAAYLVNSERLVDLDGDGRAELVTTENSGAAVIRYLDANGDQVRYTAFPGLGQAPVATATGDFDGDGRLDLVVVDSGDLQARGALYVFLQGADGTFTSSGRISSFDYATTASVGDVDEDGRPDVVIATNGSGVLLYRGNGTRVDATPTTLLPSPFNDAQAELSDVDGDGHLDLVTNNAEDGVTGPTGIEIRRGNGNGTFAAPTLLHTRLLSQDLALGDLNGDGRPDIVAAGFSPSGVSSFLAVHLSQPGGGFGAPVRFGARGSSDVARVALVDLNGDGTLDVVAYTGSGLVTYLNDGTGAFAAGPTLTAGSRVSLAAGAVRPGGAPHLYVGELDGAIEQWAVAGTLAPPPVLSVPASVTVEAAGPAGAVVAFAATADDASPVTCSPASGSTFALGTTTVSCSATGVGGTSSASFAVTVRDTTAPVLAVPAAVTVDATGPAGATAAWTVTARDTVDGVVPATCTPAAGSVFPAGDTRVRCSAVDGHGNTAAGSFVVHVRGLSEQLADLAAAVTGVGSGNSLLAKVTSPTCGSLGAFVNEVEAQAGKQLPSATAADFVAAATRIAALLGCR